MNPDPHKILGIEKNATVNDIKRAYRVKAAKYHPDVGGDAWVFQQVQDAYQTLMSIHWASPTKADQQPPRPKQNPNSPEQTPPPRTASGHPKTTSNPAEPVAHTQPNSKQPHPIHQVLFTHLPLQNETTYFILVNCLDVFMTYILIRFGAIESNPLANYFLQRWNFAGMIYFKMAIVAFVCIIVQLVARQNLTKARYLIFSGIAIVGTVVIYSSVLLVRRFL
jgi:hypothetical protein